MKVVVTSEEMLSGVDHLLVEARRDDIAEAPFRFDFPTKPYAFPPSVEVPVEFRFVQKRVRFSDNPRSNPKGDDKTIY